MATQFKHLDIGDKFYIGTNSHPSCIWTKIGHNRAKSWAGLSAPFSPNELIIPISEETHNE